MTTAQTPATRQGEALTHPRQRPVGVDVVLFTWFAVGCVSFGLGLMWAGHWSWALGALMGGVLAGVYAWAARRSDRAKAADGQAGEDGGQPAGEQE